MTTHASDEINTKKHHLVGVRWPVTGSKGDRYAVFMRDSGIECDCIAYTKCKQIKAVEKNLINPKGY